MYSSSHGVEPFQCHFVLVFQHGGGLDEKAEEKALSWQAATVGPTLQLVCRNTWPPVQFDTPGETFLTWR